MKIKNSIVNIHPNQLPNIVIERLATSNEIKNVDILKHTKILAEEAFMPFYSYGVGCMNIHCHIHDSYSEKEFNNILSK